MAGATLDNMQQGNGLGVCLPTAVARAAHLRVDQRVRIEAVQDRAIIAPVENARLALEQRLAPGGEDLPRYARESHVDPLANGIEATLHATDSLEQASVDACKQFIDRCRNFSLLHCRFLPIFITTRKT